MRPAYPADEVRRGWHVSAGERSAANHGVGPQCVVTGHRAADLAVLAAMPVRARQALGGLPCTESPAGVAQLAGQPSCKRAREPALSWAAIVKGQDLARIRQDRFEL